MDVTQQKEAIDVVQKIAFEAGKLLLEGYRQDVKVEMKGQIDLVTEYDLKSEKLIRAQLAEAFPDHVVDGEEEGSSGQSDTNNAKTYVWYIDPIDGTTNYTHGHPFFSVSIGLWRGQEEPILGVVYAPAMGVMWLGAKDMGSFRADWLGDWTRQSCRPTQTDSLVKTLCSTGFPYDRATNPNNNTLEAAMMLPKIRGFRRCGSAAMDLCFVADGTYDLYWEQGLKVWDSAAGAVILLAAGGRITDYEGKPAGLYTNKIVASGGGVHQEVLDIISQAKIHRDKGYSVLPS